MTTKNSRPWSGSPLPAHAQLRGRLRIAASWTSASLLTFCLFVLSALAGESPLITFDHSFEGGSLGWVETLGDTRFRCHVKGQQDERARNRQASWYYFRMDGVQNRDLTLLLTNFVGEYNGRPGSCPMNAGTLPVFSTDNLRWRHFDDMAWDDVRKEATLRLRPEQNSIWIAHVPPYPYSRLSALLAELEKSPFVRIEIIGKSVQGRGLHLITISDPGSQAPAGKTVWLQARQHAWEAPTSHVMEGALRFLVSDHPRARELRRKVRFKCMPMLDPDGCVLGHVRFNTLGYDLNRHWDQVQSGSKDDLAAMPEIYHTKKAIYGHLDAGGSIDLLVTLHNTETAEYLETQVDKDPIKDRLRLFQQKLETQTLFDPSTPLRFSARADGTMNALWRERRIPVVLMEQRIARSSKLGRQPTVEDRLAFGRQLVEAMADTVLP